MTNTSKLNPLTIIIAISVILFASSFIWKLNYVDNSEEITPVNVIPKDLTELRSNVTVDRNSGSEDLPTNPIYTSEEPIEVRRSKHSANMNKHIMLTSGDQVMEVILKLEELGQYERAKEYIEFLKRRFPDYEM